jgi:hypothetical protein
MVKGFDKGRLLPLNHWAVAILDFGLAYFHNLSLVISFSLRNAMEILGTEQPSYTKLSRRDRLAAGRKRGNRK